MEQLTAKKVIKKIRETTTVWEIYLQIRNRNKVIPYQKIFSGNISDCISYLNNADSSMMKDSSGVLVSDNAIGNVFFKFDNGKLATSPSPYPGLKYMTAKEFQLFR